MSKEEIKNCLKTIGYIYPEFREFLLELKKSLGEKTWRELILYLDEFMFKVSKRTEENIIEQLGDW